MDSEAKLRKTILTKAALSLCSEIFKDDYEKVLKDDQKKALLFEEVGRQIEDCWVIIENVRKFHIKNWDAFNHLSDAAKRKEKIRSSLQMKTFRMILNDTKTEVEVKRGDKTLQKLQADSPKVADLQVASIVVESVILVLEVIGVNIPDNEKEVDKAIDVATSAISRDKILNDLVNKIVDAYKAGDNYEVAKGIFNLVIQAVNDGTFWDIVQRLCSDMPWYDWVLTSAKIAAFIATLIATGGLAEIAELVVILLDSGEFLAKLVNLSTFRELRKKE